VSSFVPTIPESAPFTAPQRAWLNGFFAGLFSRQNGVASPTTTSAPVAAPTAEEETPWHDPAIELPQRMEMAKGKSLPLQLMAAMAQLDCGTCGYLCKSYAQAISTGADKDLTKCSPGGKPTAKKLREIMSGAVVVSPAAPDSAAASIDTKSYSRANPFPARLIVNKALNSIHSAKDTRQIAFDLAGSGLTYNVGDSLGVYPENDPQLVDEIIALLNFAPDQPVGVGQGNSKPLREALLAHFTITSVSDSMLELLARVATDPLHQAALKDLLADTSPGLPEGVALLDVLSDFSSARPPAIDFVAALSPLQPRLYSISSSLKATPDQVHLTVGVVRYTNPRGRKVAGVASTFLADRAASTTTRLFVHKAHGFALPADPTTPIIMVGPGTGIAPFRAFLQERAATNSPGPNWLFFGDQKRDHDFLYREEFESMLSSGLLNKLDVAFSRDQSEKVYVQNKMLDHAADIWKWLNTGAHFYVCGDAKRMAKDVDNALKQIARQQGQLTEAAANDYITQLSRAGRYQRDVY
jgi:sulfite reductase (NADPH) flavoprotein alpha-component